jgi:hypothetical protein
MVVKYIYTLAQLLIFQYGENAESFAIERMQFFMEKNDPKIAGLWMAVMGAIKELAETRNQRYLN